MPMPITGTPAATWGIAPVPVMGIAPPMCPAASAAAADATVVMSWMLARRLSFLFWELRRIKYFWAWLATWGGREGGGSSKR